MCRSCRLLHRYIHGKVVCCFPPPITSIWYFSPLYPSSPSPPTTVTPLVPPNRPQCVMLPSLCPCVLIVQHPPMNDTMQCFIFCSCVSFLRMMIFRFIHTPMKDMNSTFYGCIIFHGVYVPHCPNPVYHRWAFGLIPGLCYCKQCCNEHLCACVLIVERFIVLWIYTQ